MMKYAKSKYKGTKVSEKVSIVSSQEKGMSTSLAIALLVSGWQLSEKVDGTEPSGTLWIFHGRQYYLLPPNRLKRLMYNKIAKIKGKLK